MYFGDSGGIWTERDDEVDACRTDDCKHAVLLIRDRMFNSEHVVHEAVI